MRQRKGDGCNEMVRLGEGDGRVQREGVQGGRVHGRDSTEVHKGDGTREHECTRATGGQVRETVRGWTKGEGGQEARMVFHRIQRRR